MTYNLTGLIAQRLGLPERGVAECLRLLGEGATVAFISRYRKEATGSMTDVQVEQVRQLGDELSELAHRKDYILQTIEAQEKLTPELRTEIEQCWQPTRLEDLYLPYKPKRRTRAAVARERGLEPLAHLLLHQPHREPEQEARRFLSDQVPTEADALQGARDIMAEGINEDASARDTVRRSFEAVGVVRSRVVKGKEEEAAKYRDYFDLQLPLRRCPGHRLLAMRRGESEGLLRVQISPRDDQEAIERLARRFVRPGSASAAQVELAVEDAYKRLLRPSIETEYAASTKQKADQEAIGVFAGGLRQLLLTPPLGAKRIMGIDPGLRTGCKVVCLDEQGTLLHYEAIFPHPPRREWARASMALRALVEDYRIEAVAIGNGTGGRETEELVQGLGLPGVDVFLVSEDGASVYSASATGREEFPTQDVTVRGAVSIGRRLADPLAELVKIDPKSLGVGQYQHDVNQTALARQLDATVESCVNQVGVNLNTASRHLLTYVSGLGPALAKAVVDYRTQNGPFRSRRDLLSVPRLGPKAYEQCAGFLRIPSADNPLDNTAVHPERYALVEQMAKDAGCTVAELIASQERRSSVDLQRYVQPGSCGLPTLTDIMAELSRPGRDPRGKAKVFSFDSRLRTLDDLREGMELDGVVTNITNFGCFVDMGIKVKGLVHVSQMADRYVRDPAQVVHIQQRVRVRVLSIDEERGRVALSMKGLSDHS